MLMDDEKKESELMKKRLNNEQEEKKNNSKKGNVENTKTDGDALKKNDLQNQNEPTKNEAGSFHPKADDIVDYTVEGKKSGSARVEISGVLDENTAQTLLHLLLFYMNRYGFILPRP